ncbi:oxidation resistance protein 1 isoform X1 [Sesamum indicum]|uniref:Oxidation resistance protein 1 isoform X1 n=2 Tax=Sesamum indicum TaxID=4182 RepID=A0A6I9TVV1_SESIN|nr:oxidation resistance protein 1 isoform X1 [Sesamum indicum]
MIKEEKITHDIKDRVSQKLSRFFTATPSSPTPDQESEARPFAEHAKSLSSMVSRLPSASLDWLRQSANYNGVKPIGSLSLKWRSKSFLRKDKPLYGFTESGHEHDDRAMIKSHEENGEPDTTESPSQNYKSSNSHQESQEPGSGRSTSSIGNIASIPHSFSQSMPCLRDESLFISPELYQFLKPSLPNIVKGCQWVLLYSSIRHGISLRTLIRQSADLPGPCLLITGDMQGAVFGGLLDCPLKPTAVWKYQGTNQTFVFTTICGEPRLFKATGANRYFYMCLNNLLAFGGGANFALCLNEDLLSGTSGPSETFGNSCLAHVQEFELKNVELWGFAHASQYHT